MLCINYERVCGILGVTADADGGKLELSEDKESSKRSLVRGPCERMCVCAPLLPVHRCAAHLSSIVLGQGPVRHAREGQDQAADEEASKDFPEHGSIEK